MFYQPGTTPHNLPHDPFKVLFSPSFFLQNEVHRMLICNAGLRGPPPNRLDQHKILQRPRQPRPVLPIHKSNLRPALRHVLSEPNALSSAKRHCRKRRNHGSFRLESSDLRPPRSCEYLRGTSPLRDRRVRARGAGKRRCEPDGCTHGQGIASEVRVCISFYAAVTCESAHGDCGCCYWAGCGGSCG